MKNDQAQFYVTGGTLKRDAPSYVVRQADTELYEGLSSSQFCYVLTSRQMGKSSLMVRIATRLRSEKVAVAVLDLTAIGLDLTPEQWYAGMLERIGQQLDLEDELEEFWENHENLGLLQRWMSAVQKVVLEHFDGQVIIFVDEIDFVLSLPFPTDEFFAGIRECYNRRSTDPEMSRLTFCLLGVAAPTDLIKNVHTTPFNVGRRIELTDFNQAEASPLAEGMGRDNDLGFRLLSRVLYWTGGHPYLTQRLCRVVSEDSTVTDETGVDRLCEDLFLSARAREKDDNLLFVSDRILRSGVDLAALLDLYAKVLADKNVPDDEANPLISVLRLSGIIRVEDGRLKVRNRIYRHVFNRDWVRANMPDAEIRRQRAAYRRGILRTGGIAAAILLLISSLAVYAFAQRNNAISEKRRADQYAEMLKAKADDLQRALNEAEDLRQKAEERTQEAEEQRQIAIKKQAEEEEQRSIAEKERKRAEEQAKIASDREVEAKRQQTLANERLQEVVARTKDVHRLLYAGDFNLAQRMWEGANITNVINLLSQQNDEEMRGFEYDYLWQLSHSGALTYRYPEVVTAVTYSSDGKLFMADLDGEINVLDSQSRKSIQKLKSESKILSMSVSPTNNLIAIGGLEKTITLLDVSTGKVKAVLDGQQGAILSVAFSPNGAFLASASNDRTVKLWDISGQKEVATLIAHNGSVNTVAFSPDGTKLATGGSDGLIRLWGDGGDPVTIEAHQGEILSLTFSTDGKILATGGDDNVAKLWEVNSAREIRSFRGHTKKINSIAFSTDGRALATGSDDNTVKLWDVETGKDITLRGHTNSVKTLAFSPDGKNLLSGSDDKTARIWDLVNSQDQTTLGEFKTAVNSLAFSPNGETLATAEADKTVRIWDVIRQKETHALEGHTAPVNSLMFSSSGREIVTGSDDGTAKLWEVSSARLIRTLEAKKGKITSATFSPDDKLVATASTSGSIMLWEKNTGQVIHSIEEQASPVRTLAFSRDGKLAALRIDGTVNIYNTSSGATLLTLRISNEKLEALTEEITPLALAFSPDDKTLVTWGDENTIKLWDTNTGELIKTLYGHTKPVVCVTFTPDRKRMATGSADNTVKLWDTGSWREVATFKGHEKDISSVAFSPDGTIMATGSKDMTVKLWYASKKRDTKSD